MSIFEKVPIGTPSLNRQNQKIKSLLKNNSLQNRNCSKCYSRNPYKSH